MINKLSTYLTSVLCRKNIIKADEAEVYSYGFELLISGVISFVIIVAAGLILDIFVESMIFYIIFVGVRPFSGGYHAETHLKCKLTFLSVYTGVMLFSFVFTENYHPAYHFLLILISILTMISYAPIEHPNKPLDENERCRNKKIAILVSVLISICSVGVTIISIKYAAIISITLLSVSLLMIIPNFSDEEVRE